MEMSEEEFQQIVEKYRKNWRPPMATSGFIEVWRERFTYRRFPYEIALLRHYNFNNSKYALNKIGMHAVLEYPKELEELADLLRKEFDIYDWLNRDTLHAGQEDWTKEQMIEQMHIEAKECIDWLLDEAINELLRKLKSIIEKVMKYVLGRTA